MIEIQLTRGYVAIVDDQDADLAKFNWCALVSTDGRRIYAQRAVNNKHVFLHRVILTRKLGRAVPKDIYTDHKDGNTLNNRRKNLRLATCGQNNANSPDRVRASQYRGITRHGSGWKAQIGKIGGMKYLGTYRTEEEAARAYNEAAKAKYGPFARLNKVR